jgi:hypothetical protein
MSDDVTPDDSERDATQADATESDGDDREVTSEAVPPDATEGEDIRPDAAGGDADGDDSAVTGDGPQEPGPERHRGRKGSVTVLAIAAAAVVVVVVAAVLLIANDDGDGDVTTGEEAGDADQGSPAHVVEQYFAAAEGRDCETLIDLVSDATWEDVGVTDEQEALANCRDAAETGQQLEGMSLDEIGDVTEDGDAATVEVNGTYEGEPLTETFRLVRESGSWKLDLRS